MARERHTPRPWKLEQGTMIMHRPKHAPQVGAVLIARVQRGPIAPDTVQCNARVLTAAASMLAVLRLSRSALESLLDGCSNSGEYPQQREALGAICAVLYTIDVEV